MGDLAVVLGEPRIFQRFEDKAANQGKSAAFVLGGQELGLLGTKPDGTELDPLETGLGNLVEHPRPVRVGRIVAVEHTP